MSDSILENKMDSENMESMENYKKIFNDWEMSCSNTAYIDDDLLYETFLKEQKKLIKFGGSFLYMLIKHNRVDCLKEILCYMDYFKYINDIMLNYNQIPLYYVCQYGCDKMVKLFISKINYSYDVYKNNEIYINKLLGNKRFNDHNKLITCIDILKTKKLYKTGYDYLKHNAYNIITLHDRSLLIARYLINNNLGRKIGINIFIYIYIIYCILYICVYIYNAHKRFYVALYLYVYIHTIL